MGFIFSFVKKIIQLILVFGVFVGILVLIPNLPPYTKFSSIELTPTQTRVGPLAPNGALNNAEKLHKDKILGPEAFQVINGELYTSLASGEIVKLSPGGHITFVTKVGQPCTGLSQEHICGRPLGFEIDAKTNSLYLVDAYHGIWKTNLKTDKKQLLVSPQVEINGRLPRTFNSIALAKNGDFYWTDSTSDYSLKDGALSVLSDPSGRLFYYNAARNESKVLLDNLWFANGVAISPDSQFVVVAETARYRLLKYYIDGPKKGKSEVFVDGLPGTPDNIRALPDGSGLLVGLYVVFDDEHPLLVRSMARAPVARKFLARLQSLIELPFAYLNTVYPHFLFEDVEYFDVEYFVSKLYVVFDDEHPLLVRSMARAPVARKFLARLQTLIELPFAYLNTVYPHFLFEDVEYFVSKLYVVFDDEHPLLVRSMARAPVARRFLARLQSLIELPFAYLNTVYPHFLFEDVEYFVSKLYVVFDDEHPLLVRSMARAPVARRFLARLQSLIKLPFAYLNTVYPHFLFEDVEYFVSKLYVVFDDEHPLLVRSMARAPVARKFLARLQSLIELPFAYLNTVYPHFLFEDVEYFVSKLYVVFDDEHPLLVRSMARAPVARKFLARLQSLIELPFAYLNSVYPHFLFEDVEYFIGHFKSISGLVPPMSGLLHLDWNGNIVASYFNTDGSLGHISDAIVYNNKLHLGSPHSHYIGVVSAPPQLQKAFGSTASKTQDKPKEEKKEVPKVAKTPDTKPTQPPTPKPTTVPKPTTTTTPKPTTTTPKPTTTTPEPTTTTPKPSTTTPKPATKPTPAPPKPATPKQSEAKPAAKPVETKPKVEKPAENAAKKEKSGPKVPHEKSVPEQIPIEEEIPSDTAKPNKETLKVIKKGGPTEIPNPHL